MSDPWDKVLAPADSSGPARERPSLYQAHEMQWEALGQAGRGIFDAGKGVVDAAQRLMQGYHPGSGEFSDAQAHDALVAGPGALLPGFGRAAGGVGAAGGKILARSDAQKLMREMAQAGKTDKEITAALNERFAPLIDEGTEIGKNMVTGSRQRAQRRGDFELGAMGGQGSSKGDLITPEAVVQWLHEAGVPVKQVKTTGKDNTTYVKFEPPGNPPASGDAMPTVRIPSPEVPHQGRGAKASERGSYFDTAQHERGKDPRTVFNEGGDPLANPDALEAALKWRTSSAPPGENWLVRPDQAPKGARYQRDPAPTAPATGTDPHPDQMKLLSGGVPTPGLQPNMTTPPADPNVLKLMEEMKREREEKERRERTGPTPPPPSPADWDKILHPPGSPP